MAKLRLSALNNDKPVKVTVELSATILPSRGARNASSTGFGEVGGRTIFPFKERSQLNGESFPQVPERDENKITLAQF